MTKIILPGEPATPSLPKLEGQFPHPEGIPVIGFEGTLKRRLRGQLTDLPAWTHLGNYYLGLARTEHKYYSEAEICFWAARYLLPDNEEIGNRWFECYVRNRLRNDEPQQAQITRFAERARTTIPRVLELVRSRPERLKEELESCLNALTVEGMV